MIKNFNQWNSINENASIGSNWTLIYEAIKPEQEEQYLSVIRGENAEVQMNSILNKIAELPGAKRSSEGDRVYLPLPKLKDGYQESPLELEIKSVLGSAGYEVKDYKQGIAVDKGMQNREIKIGKVLNRLKETELLKQFTNDKERATSRIESQNMMLVFSKNKVDIAAMSTGRGWTSCMNLDGGINAKYVSCDIEEGTIICYLIKEEDKNVENPSGRILIKPYVNLFPPGDIIYVPDPRYGTTPSNFEREVDMIMRKVQGGKKEGIYRLITKLYQDLPRSEIRRGVITKYSEEGISGTITEITRSALSGKRKINTRQEIEEILDELVIQGYRINDDLTVDVNDDVDIGDLKAKVIPFQFGKVTGSFNCSGNELTSLKGCPTSVGRSFYCSNNKLVSLKGCPPSVVDFRCSNNLITDFDVKIETLTFECLENKPTLTKELIIKHPGIFAKLEYIIGTYDDVKCLDSAYNEIKEKQDSGYIGNQSKNEKLMVKKFNQWVNESLHSGVPVDFFKKIHQYSKKRPLDIQADITDDLVNNDLEDVSHHFYELGTNPPEEEK